MELNNKVFVTGGNGFLGRVLIKELQSHGYQIVSYDIENGQDILNYSNLVLSMKNCNSCVHLAAVADLYEAEADPEHCTNVNIKGTNNIIKACEKLNISLFFASTCCIYGNNGESISSESSRMNPTEIYAESKKISEELIRKSNCTYSLMRLATFYGPQMRKSLATHMFIEKALNNEIVTIHGNGKQTRCYTHVEDIATGIRVLLEQIKPPPIINIASNESISVLELLDLIKQLTNKNIKTEFSTDREGQIYNSNIDCTLLKSLGWKPKWTLKEGMQQCIQYLKEGVPN